MDAHDPDGDNQFSQSRTGLALPYSNWRNRQPSSIHTKCACIYTTTMDWNDVRCGITGPFICEYDLNWISVTVPLLDSGTGNMGFLISSQGSVCHNVKSGCCKRRIKCNVVSLYLDQQYPKYTTHSSPMEVWECALFVVSNDYRQVSNIRRTKYQHLKDSRTVLRLSLPNPLKPDVKSRMKM